MNLREVTIGRSKNCDIYLDPSCQYASNQHGTIYYDGNQLMFKDSSSNGTLINNIKVHKRAVPIHHGDNIMVAGKYPLNWHQIDSFFPPTPYQPRNEVSYGGLTNIDPTPTPAIPQQAYPAQPNLSKWSWAAFLLGWIWGPFNGCWWILAVNIMFTLLAIIPIVGLFTSLISLVWAIICGINGTKWAWENKTWSSVQEFEHTQSTWNKVAVILFCISLVTGIIGAIVVIASIASTF